MKANSTTGGVYRKMRLVICAAALAGAIIGSLGAMQPAQAWGVYKKCAGQPWSAASDKYGNPGKTCVRCKDGTFHKLYSMRTSSGKIEYRDLSGKLIGVDNGTFRKIGNALCPSDPRL